MARKPIDGERAPQSLTRGQSRVVIEGVQPVVDGGAFAAKRAVGDPLWIRARVFADGHDAVAADASFWREGDPDRTSVAMDPGFNDQWSASFEVDEPGRYWFAVTAWIDRWRTWLVALSKRIAAGQDPSVDIAAGVALLREAAGAAKSADAALLGARADELAAADAGAGKSLPSALDDELSSIVRRTLPRQFAVEHGPVPLRVDRERARFSTWYEMFPRSVGTLRDCIGRLDYIAEMGFDILYLPPIHPIGRAHRKGKNNSTVCHEDDVGSPWAIGAKEGGHRDIHPDLGTLEDFEALRKAAAERGIEIALDIAFQCSPDHPYVKEHPGWFRKRPDGSIQYAENPPKKYEDIYPFDFECEDWEALWDELAGVFEVWAERGVRVFRVDNPHTKPFRFWDWCIERVQGKYPDVIFLSEAFARPAVMYRLAKGGFTQSYTYFAWKNTRWELEQYFTELFGTEIAEFFRPNAWPNTPDILNEYLQLGGRPAFAARLILAGTLCANYGIYGPAFELCEGRSVRPGSEEYLDSEKYQIRHWDIDAPHSLKPVIARLNQARRDHRSLQFDDGLQFHPTSNDQIICYSKMDRERTDAVLVVANLDPYHKQSAWIDLSLEHLGVAPDRPFAVRDLLANSQFYWTGSRNYVEIDPHELPAHLFAVRPRVRTEADFDYFA